MSRATCMCHMSTNQIHIPQYARFCCSYVTRCCSCASTLSLSINTGMNAVRGMLYVGLGANIALGVHTLNHPRSTASEMILQRVPVPKDIVNKVYRFASHMGLRYPDHLAIVTSNSMSAFSGGSTVGQEGALVALPPTHIASSVDDRLLKGVIGMNFEYMVCACCKCNSLVHGSSLCFVTLFGSVIWKMTLRWFAHTAITR
eukprot:m.91620 g.91620  ORF g.91620 m.91620 type:complete len:201 (-) comp12953_c0_seq3:909-1511(-)